MSDRCRKVNYYGQLSIRARNQNLAVEEADIHVGLEELMRFKIWTVGVEGTGAPACSV